MRWPFALSLVMTLGAFLSGCQSTGKARLERELHSRDIELSEVREELLKSQSYTKALQMELGGARGEMDPYTGETVAVPPLYPVRTLTLGRQTGGYDLSGSPGDTALQVVIEPRDVDNHVIKVPGSATVQAVEITPEGLEKPFCSWDIKTDQLRAAWKPGLFGSGYFVVLPWKTYPTQTKMRVIVQLHTADGGLFQAYKEFTIKPVPLSKQRTLPPVEEQHTPLPGRDDSLLPMPRPKETDFGPRLPPPLPPPSGDSSGPPPVPPPGKPITPQDPGPSLPPAPDPTVWGWGQTNSPQPNRTQSGWGGPTPVAPAGGAKPQDPPRKEAWGW